MLHDRFSANTISSRRNWLPRLLKVCSLFSSHHRKFYLRPRREVLSYCSLSRLAAELTMEDDVRETKKEQS